MSMQAADLEVENNWNYNLDFPRSSFALISRTHVLETIKEIFTNEILVVFLEGEEAGGVTTALAQFVNEQPGRCFSIFIKPASRFSYSLEYIRVKLAEQIKLFMDGVPLEKSTIEESEFHNLLMRLRSRIKGKTIYFLVDGLHQIPLEDEHEVSAIFRKVLPIGTDCFRFIISGRQETLGKHIGKVASKPYQLLKFSNAEVHEFLRENYLTHEELDEVTKICRGIPGRIASIKRQLNNDIPIAEILEAAPEENLGFIKLEFRSLAQLNEHQKQAIAVLAYSKQLVSIAEISEIGKIGVDDFLEAVKLCPFLEDRSQEYVEFASNAHRKYAEKILQQYQSYVTDAQIEFLLKTPMSDTALLFLPTYYQQKNQLKAIIELISNDHYCKLLDSTQSISQLRERAELGFKSARQLEETLAVFQFAIQKSLFIDLAEGEASTFEIDALLALGKRNKALNLIGRTVTKESKLSLLSAYADGLQKKSISIEPEIRDQIKELSKQIDFTHLRNVAVNIAENLVSVDPSLAIEILEKALSRASDSKSKDLVFFRLSMIAAGQDREEGDNSLLQARIKNKALQDFSIALSRFYKDFDASTLIDFIEPFDGRQKINFLKNYLRTHQYQSGTLLLVNHALSVIVKETDYTPKASDYADLAYPLASADADPNELTELIARFDSQLGLVKKSAVSRDIVTLSTSLAHAELRISPNLAKKRILETYYEIGSISSGEIRVECLAKLLMALHSMDPDDNLEIQEGFKCVVDDDLENALSEILKDTAEQFSSIETALPAIAKYDAEKAINIALSLNTRLSRNKAFQLIAEIVVTLPFSSQKSSQFFRVIKMISDSDTVDETVLNCASKLGRVSGGSEWINCVAIATNSVKSQSKKVTCKILTFEASTEAEQKSAIPDLAGTVLKFLETSDETTARNEVCFKAVQVIAAIDIETAEEIYDKAVHARGAVEADNESVQQNFLQSLALVVRSFGTLFRTRLVNSDMINRLSALIERLPCSRRRMTLYVDLVTRAWIAKDTDLCIELVNSYCRPALERAKRTDLGQYEDLLYISFTALYLANQQFALDQIQGASSEVRGAAIFDCSEVLRRKLTKQDPFPSDDTESHQITYFEALDILNLLGHVDTDAAFFVISKRLVAAVNGKLGRVRITSQQRRDIGDKLLKLIDKKLPDLNNIKHDGYKICCQAFAYKLTDAQAPLWKDLLSQTEGVDNISDKSFILSVLIQSAPSRAGINKKDLLKKVMECCNRIPSIKDRLGRLELFTKASLEQNIQDAKNSIRDSLVLSLQIENPDEAVSFQKTIIDMADQLESGFADTLLELMDDDPARSFSRNEMKHSVGLLKAKKDMADAKDISDIGKINSRYLSEAAWKNLSGLLANRVETKPLSLMSGYIAAAGTMGLGEIYSVLCWYVENSSRKYISTEDAKDQLLPLCEALLTSAELAFAIVNRKVKANRALDQEVVYEHEGGIVVTANSREESFEFIRSWMSANASEYIKICDPYFSKNDLDILKMVLSECPDCIVYILTSTDYLKQSNSASLEDFERSWRAISDQSPPQTDIISVGNDADDKPLVHDRWLITKGSGLRLGTSLNSIGNNKLSEISRMSTNEIQSCELQIDKFLNREAHTKSGRVRTSIYSL